MHLEDSEPMVKVNKKFSFLDEGKINSHNKTDFFFFFFFSSPSSSSYYYYYYFLYFFCSPSSFTGITTPYGF